MTRTAKLLPVAVGLVLVATLPAIVRADLTGTSYGGTISYRDADETLPVDACLMFDAVYDGYTLGWDTGFLEERDEDGFRFDLGPVTFWRVGSAVGIALPGRMTLFYLNDDGFTIRGVLFASDCEID